MRIWYFSDLHIGPRGDDALPDTHPEHDAIVVCGDVMDGSDERLESWLMTRFSDEERRRLIYVPGNHDYYGLDLAAGIARLRGIARATGIHVLDDEVVEIGGVAFAGTTLWTDFRFWGEETQAGAIANARTGVMDFVHVAGFTPEQWLERHERGLAFLREAVTPDTVVVTHHAPHEDSLPAEYLHSPRHAWAAPAYASNLAPLLRDLRPWAWIHGHTHICCSYRIHGVPILSNARGRGFAWGYDGGSTFDLPEPRRAAGMRLT